MPGPWLVLFSGGRSIVFVFGGRLQSRWGGKPLSNLHHYGLSALSFYGALHVGVLLIMLRDLINLLCCLFSPQALVIGVCDTLVWTTSWGRQVPTSTYGTYLAIASVASTCTHQDHVSSPFARYLVAAPQRPECFRDVRRWRVNYLLVRMIGSGRKKILPHLLSAAWPRYL